MRRVTRREQTRLAILETHQWRGHWRHRILKRQRIPFTGSVAALIASAARLNPRWRPRALELDLDKAWRPDNERMRLLSVLFGRDEHQTQTMVRIELKHTDVPLVIAHIARRVDQAASGTLCCEYVDGDGGDEVSVPRVSVAELANLDTSSIIQ